MLGLEAALFVAGVFVGAALLMLLLKPKEGRKARVTAKVRTTHPGSKQ